MRPKRVLIVTGQHFATAPRKVDLHFIVDTLLQQSIPVDFFTWRLSPISRLSNDGRWNFARSRPRNRWVGLCPGLEEFIWYTALHPLNLRKSWLNSLTAPVFRHFGLLLPRAVQQRLGGYSHIVVESGPSPLLAQVLRRGAPQAHVVYHAADRLSTIDVHPVVISTLIETIDLYDSIHIMAEAMRGDFPETAPVFYLPHGISRRAFDEQVNNPYPQPKNAVSVGDMLFDGEAVDALAQAFPEWTFHLFGRKAVPPKPRTNIVTHGEVPFGQIIGYMKFADIGLAPYRAGRGADYLSQSSLKMIQYTYCRLPIVAPEFAAAGREHVCPYVPGDSQSVRAAFTRAVTFDRSTIDVSAVQDWSETVRALFEPGSVERGQ